MTRAPIDITGATGYLGGHIARKLAALGIPLRLIVRDKIRAPNLPDTEITQADYFDGAAMQQALTGAGTLFMVSGNDFHDRLQSHRLVIDAAALAGVRRVVYTSFLAAAADALFTASRDHFHTEQHLAASGLEWTAMRNAFYAEIAVEMIDNGVIKGPGGTGRMAPVTRDDVVDTAVGLLTSDAPPHGPLDVTGPEALSLADMARIYSEATGKPARYVEETLEEAYTSRADPSVSAAARDAWVSTYTAIAAGQLDVMSDTVARYAGHAPMTFATFLRATISQAR
jgi:NAD(P)H dehydrogenase (quinone)